MRRRDIGCNQITPKALSEFTPGDTSFFFLSFWKDLIRWEVKQLLFAHKILPK